MPRISLFVLCSALLAGVVWLSGCPDQSASESASMPSGEVLEESPAGPQAESGPDADLELAEGYAARARESLLQNDYDEAIALADKAIDAAPDLAQAYLVRGEAQAYRAGAKLFQDSGDGEALAEKTGALVDLERAIELDDSDPRAFIARGLWNLDMGLHEDASSDFTRAIELDPEDGEAYYHRAVAWDGVDDEKWAADARKAEELGYTP